MSVVLRTAKDAVGSLGASIEHTANHLLPPKQRERVLENLRSFSMRNPKLASFLAAQTALTGLPIVLFLGFVAVTFVVSFVTCVLLAVIAALVFTFLTASFALLFVVPAVFIGSCTASIAFVWGLAGYMVLQRINGGETPVQPGKRFGDTLDELTGRRLRDLVDQTDADVQQEHSASNRIHRETIPRGGEGDIHRKTPDISSDRRHHRQTDESSFTGEVGATDKESGARGTQTGKRDLPKSETASRDTRINGHGPVGENGTDWTTQFQREGLTA